MNTLGWIITGTIGIGAAALLLKKNASSNKTTTISDALKKQIISSAEEVEVLRMADVTAWFQTFSMKKGTHIPFVAVASKFAESLKIDNLEAKENSYIMGVYNDNKDELEQIKLLHAQKVDDKFKSIMGKEPIVVLE